MTHQQEKNVWIGVKYTASAIVAFVLIVFISVRYGDDLQKVNWRLVAFLAMGVFLTWLMYEWNSKKPNYNAIDLLMTNNQVDLSKHVIAAFALLSIWVVVQQALSNKPVETLLLGVLGIFVGGKAIGDVSTAMANRPAPNQVNVIPTGGAGGGDVNVKQGG